MGVGRGILEQKVLKQNIWRQDDEFSSREQQKTENKLKEIKKQTNNIKTKIFNKTSNKSFVNFFRFRINSINTKKKRKEKRKEKKEVMNLEGNRFLQTNIQNSKQRR